MGVSTIMGYVEEHQILRPEQHVFRRGRSCETEFRAFVDEAVSYTHLTLPTTRSV